MRGEDAVDSEALRQPVALRPFAARLADLAPARAEPARDERSRDEPDEPEEGSRAGRLVRPYAMTRGRTAADVATISLEAQIQVSGDVPPGKLYRWEAARILELAASPIALIELSARASIPIGVARVIVSDLAQDGALVVQRPTTQPTYTSLLEKVLAGVRAL